MAALALLLVTGCSQGQEGATQTRFAAVKASGNEPAPAKWCDVSFAGDSAPQLELPAVVPARPGGLVPEVPSDRWVWVNLWATWCGPCRKEMPLLESWKSRLAKEGAPVDLWYLSLDENGDDLTRFLNRNPELAPGASVRLSSLEALEPWLKKYQLDASAAIPIQVLAAPGGKVRCVRVGSLNDGDYRVVKSLIK